MGLNEEFIDVGHDIIGAAFDVRRHAGRGLREAYYQAAFAFELEQRGHQVDQQVLVPAFYRGKKIMDSFQADMVIDNKVLIELKAIKNMKESEISQIITYLKLSGFKLGYLINFGAEDFKLGRSTEPMPWDFGIYRLVNNI